MLYGTKCWVVTEQHVPRMSLAEMRMLRWMSGKMKKDRTRNESIQGNLRVAPIGNKMTESRLRWFSYVQWRPRTALVKSELVQVEGSKKGNGKAQKGVEYGGSKKRLDDLWPN